MQEAVVNHPANDLLFRKEPHFDLKTSENIIRTSISFNLIWGITGCLICNNVFLIFWSHFTVCHRSVTIVLPRLTLSILCLTFFWSLHRSPSLVSRRLAAVAHCGVRRRIRRFMKLSDSFPAPIWSKSTERSVRKAAWEWRRKESMDALKNVSTLLPWKQPWLNPIYIADAVRCSVVSNLCLKGSGHKWILLPPSPVSLGLWVGVYAELGGCCDSSRPEGGRTTPLHLSRWGRSSPNHPRHRRHSKDRRSNVRASTE